MSGTRFADWWLGDGAERKGASWWLMVCGNCVFFVCAVVGVAVTRDFNAIMLGTIPAIIWNLTLSAINLSCA